MPLIIQAYYEEFISQVRSANHSRWIGNAVLSLVSRLSFWNGVLFGSDQSYSVFKLNHLEIRLTCKFLVFQIDVLWSMQGANIVYWLCLDHYYFHRFQSKLISIRIDSLSIEFITDLWIQLCISLHETVQCTCPSYQMFGPTSPLHYPINYLDEIVDFCQTFLVTLPRNTILFYTVRRICFRSFFDRI